MRMVKFGLSAILTLSLIQSAQAEPWSWLDNPEKQKWSEITINGYERQIVFSIPEKAYRGASVIRVPALEKGLNDQVINVPASALNKVSHRVIGFDWERRWGGFFKKDVTDYSLSVHVRHVDDAQLLNLSVAERIERIRDQYKQFYAEHDSVPAAKEYFFEQFKVEPYVSSQGFEWVWENKPNIVKESINFLLPISDDRELLFWFYYRMEVKGPKKSPEWLERRKALSRKILDTVRIIPDPYKD